MKFYQYQEDSEIGDDWRFIYTIMSPSGFFRERNPIRKKIEDYDYDEFNYDNEEESLHLEYSSTFIYSTGE